MTTDSKASDVEARERKLFQKSERAARPNYYLPHDFDLNVHGRYRLVGLQAKWEGWLARASQQPSAQWQFQCKACALLFSANENVGGALSCPRCLCSTVLPHSPDTERAE